VETPNIIYVTGKSFKSTVCQLGWNPDGMLWSVDESEGLWQLYRYNLASKTVEYVLISGSENSQTVKAVWFLWEVSVVFTQVPKSKADYKKLYISISGLRALVLVYAKAGVTGTIIYDITTNAVTELPLGFLHIESNGI